MVHGGTGYKKHIIDLEKKYKNYKYNIPNEDLVKEYKLTKNQEAFEKLILNNIGLFFDNLKSHTYSADITEDQLFSLFLDTIFHSFENYDETKPYFTYLYATYGYNVYTYINVVRGGGSKRTGERVTKYNHESLRLYGSISAYNNEEKNEEVINSLVKNKIIYKESANQLNVAASIYYNYCELDEASEISYEPEFDIDNGEKNYIIEHYNELTKNLKDKDLELLSIRFGLNNKKAMSLKQIAEKENVKRQAIDQRLKRILYKMYRNAKEIEKERVRKINNISKNF